MRLRTIEKFSEGKFRDDRNEDGIYEGKHFVAVIDGSTAAGRIAGKAGGRIATEVIQYVLATLAADATAHDFAATATRELAAVAARYSAAAPYAAAVVVSIARREIWRIGDCPFAIDGHWRIPEPNPHETAFFGFRRMMLSGYSGEGRPSVAGEALADVTRDWLAMTRHWLNAGDHPFAFVALGGAPPPSRFIEIFALPGEARQLTLASDGAVVSPTQQRAPADVGDMLRQIADLRARDPDCRELFAYWRGFLDGATYLDDTTLLRLSIES